MTRYALRVHARPRSPSRRHQVSAASFVTTGPRRRVRRRSCSTAGARGQAGEQQRLHRVVRDLGGVDVQTAEREPGCRTWLALAVSNTLGEAPVVQELAGVPPRYPGPFAVRGEDSQQPLRTSAVAPSSAVVHRLHASIPGRYGAHDDQSRRFPSPHSHFCRSKGRPARVAARPGSCGKPRCAIDWSGRAWWRAFFSPLVFEHVFDYSSARWGGTTDRRAGARWSASSPESRRRRRRLARTGRRRRRQPGLVAQARELRATRPDRAGADRFRMPNCTPTRRTASRRGQHARRSWSRRQPGCDLRGHRADRPRRPLRGGAVRRGRQELDVGHDIRRGAVTRGTSPAPRSQTRPARTYWSWRAAPEGLSTAAATARPGAPGRRREGQAALATSTS